MPVNVFTIIGPAGAILSTGLRVNRESLMKLCMCVCVCEREGDNDVQKAHIYYFLCFVLFLNVFTLQSHRDILLCFLLMVFKYLHFTLGS